MNEIELLQHFRDDVPEPSTDAWLRARATLNAAKQEPVTDNRSYEPARSVRRRRAGAARDRRVGVGIAGVAAAVALAVGLTGVLTPTSNRSAGTPRHPGTTEAPTRSTQPIRDVGFVLTANTNGTLTLTMSQMLDPAALERALERRGILALVKTDQYCTSDPPAPDPFAIGVLTNKPPFLPGARGLVQVPGPPGKALPGDGHIRTVIDPAAIPAGSELAFDYQPGHSLLAVGLVYAKAYTCSSGAPPSSGPKR